MLFLSSSKFYKNKPVSFNLYSLCLYLLVALEWSNYGVCCCSKFHKCFFFRFLLTDFKISDYKSEERNNRGMGMEKTKVLF